MTMKAQINLSKKAKSKEVIVEKYNNIKNPALRSFQRFKNKIMDNKEEIDRLKPETIDKINAIVKIESSVMYRLTRHVMNRLDFFSRFWFPIIYIFWLNSTLWQLDANVPRFVVLFLINIFVLTIYCIMKLFEVMGNHNLTFKQAVKYYLRGK